MILRTKPILNCFAIATLTLTLAACSSGGDSAPDDNLVEGVSVADVTDSEETGESTENDGEDSVTDSEPEDVATGDGVESTEGENTEGSVPADDGVEITEGESTEGSVPADDVVDVADGEIADESVPDVDVTDSTVDDSTGSTDTLGSLPRIELDGPIYQTTDSYDMPHLFGVLKNTGGSDAVFVKASCSFFSADSALVVERLSFVKGTNVVLTTIDATTNTALKPGESGVFEISPFIENDKFSTYECKYSYDIARNTKDPEAKMELVGTVNVQEDFSGNIEYLGQVKNTGIKGLVFGKLYFITRDTADAIVDVSLTFVNGDTVTLELIDTATDTALKVGSTGTFTARTSFPLSSYGQHSVMLSWDDSEITDDIARKLNKLDSQSIIPAKEEGRTERLNSLRDAYLAN